MASTYKVSWSATAKKDLRAIIEYIAKDSPVNASNILSKIKKKCEDLYLLADRGRIVPELREFAILQYHELVIDPWRVIYKIDKRQVFVLSVIDSRRNVEDILLDRFTRSGS
ncbi:MAG: type II toxin-antitoxin system RelE/ParE family toxin [SAR324 cluster bacterium]|nr:type II toxin-antitoxin system RelE/ParE family toxin [SAR324 cluster bacterium]